LLKEPRAHSIRVVDGLVWMPLLSDEERGRARRFRFQADVDRFVAARGALRHHLGAALAVDPHTLSFDTGPFGKPYVIGQEHMQFNVSHSGDWVLIAISRRGPVGVDVELARPDLNVLELGATVFTNGELVALSVLAAHAARSAFFRLWTRKEAALKAWGVGLSLDPRSIQVGIDEAPTRVVRAPFAAFPPATVSDIAVDAMHSAAVAHCDG